MKQNLISCQFHVLDGSYSNQVIAGHVNTLVLRINLVSPHNLISHVHVTHEKPAAVGHAACVYGCVGVGDE